MIPLVNDQSDCCICYNYNILKQAVSTSACVSLGIFVSWTTCTPVNSPRAVHVLPAHVHKFGWPYALADMGECVLLQIHSGVQVLGIVQHECAGYVPYRALEGI